MKTLVKNGEYLRVDEVDVDQKIKSGWNYVQKSEWKNSVRDVRKAEEEERRKSIEERKLQRKKDKK